jgi:hypothetical protein
MFADNQIAENINVRNQHSSGKSSTAQQKFIEKLHDQQTSDQIIKLASKLGSDEKDRNSNESIDNVITRNFHLLTQTYEGRDKLVKFL